MGKLVRLQLRNIIHGKLIYICLALMILLGPVATFALGNAFSDIVKTTTVCNELISVLSVGIVETVFIVLVSCSDFNDGTTKNIIARGYTKTQLLVSKYLAIFICLIIMYIITMLFAVIFVPAYILMLGRIEAECASVIMSFVIMMKTKMKY